MKKIIPIFRGEVEDGKLHLENINDYNNYLKKLKGEVELTVRHRKKIRTINQNNLYWVYLSLIAESTGNTDQELHEFFKEEFIVPDEIELFGKKSRRYKSTTKMSPMEFSDYIKKIEVLTGILCPSKDNLKNYDII